VSLPILEGTAGWPRVLLARAAEGEVADLAAAEKGGAWSAWRRATAELTPEAVLHTITESGLRGRGGSGYPTGSKWRDCLVQEGSLRHVVATSATPSGSRASIQAHAAATAAAESRGSGSSRTLASTPIAAS
jgi:NADH:ubiquinone oxidoreductase subunit F (NADH-binding)